MKENKYNTVLEDMQEKKRYTAIEKAKRTIAMAEKAQTANDALIGDLRDAVEPIIQMAQNSNNINVVHFANKVANKFAKILGE